MRRLDGKVATVTGAGQGLGFGFGKRFAEEMTHDWLTVATPISSIHLADPNFRSATQPDRCVDNVTSGGMINRPWYGFGSVRFCRNHPAGG